jgi:hypothetical protein
VFVGAGNAQYPREGGYLAYGPTGVPLWDTRVVDPGTDPHPAYGVQASLTVADLQGGTPDVFAGSLDQESYALDASNGSALTGWPFFSADSVFSTAAAADLYGTGQTELVVGGASTKASPSARSTRQGVTCGSWTAVAVLSAATRPTRRSTPPPLLAASCRTALSA